MHTFIIERYLMNLKMRLFFAAGNEYILNIWIYFIYYKRNYIFFHCYRFTAFVTKYNLMSKDNLIVPIMEGEGATESEA